MFRKIHLIIIILLFILCTGCNKDDDNNNTGTTSGTSTGSDLKILGTPYAYATVNVDYKKFTVYAINGDKPYEYYLKEGSLPQGITLGTSTGEVSGVPLTSSTYSNIVIAVKDKNQKTAQLDPFSIKVNKADVLSVFFNPVANATQYAGYSTGAPVINGGVAPYSFSLISGKIPQGLALDATTGLITGTPTEAGLFANMVLRAQDASLQFVNSDPFYINVTKGSKLQVNIPDTIPPACLNSDYKGFTFTISNGVAPYSLYKFQAPKNLYAQLNSSSSNVGKVGGVLTDSSVYSDLKIQITDKNADYGFSKNFTIETLAELKVILPSTIPTGVINQPYSLEFGATGGKNSSYTFSLASNVQLPNGLTLESSGKITGTPSSAGQFTNMKVLVKDAIGYEKESAAFNITINAASTTSKASLFSRALVSMMSNDALLDNITGSISMFYYKNATVLGDRNFNKEKDVDEISGATDANYNYYLESLDNNIFVVAVVETEDNDKLVMSSPSVQKSFISPLTTLVSLKMENENITYEVAAKIIANDLKIYNSNLLFENYNNINLQDSSYDNLELLLLRKISQVLSKIIIDQNNILSNKQILDEFSLVVKDKLADIKDRINSISDNSSGFLTDTQVDETIRYIKNL